MPTLESCDGAIQGTMNRSKSDLLGRLANLDQYLITRTFLVGERTSLADIGRAVTFLPAFTQVLDLAQNIGTVEGDAVECSIDEDRRKNVKNNHSGIHILNNALR